MSEHDISLVCDEVSDVTFILHVSLPMSSRYHDLVQQHCLPLLKLCTVSDPGCELQALQTLSSRMLGMDAMPGYEMGGSSDLTETGLPMMARTCGGQTMLMADVGWCFIDPHERLMATRAVFSEALHAQQVSGLHTHYNRLMTMLLTCEQDALYRGQTSVVSFGADLHDTQSVINARIHMLADFDAWQFLHTWCQDILPDHADHVHWLRSLRASRFVPHSVSIGHRGGELYASLEFSRFHMPGDSTSMRALPAITGLSDDRLHGFLTAMHDLTDIELGDERLRIEVDLQTCQTLALGMSFALPPDMGDYVWIDALERRVSMKPCGITGHLDTSIRVARVGIVLEQGESNTASSELEFYADVTRTRATHTMTRSDLERRIQYARESLISRQHPEGQWPGLDAIPFGGSATFVTAFSALALASTGAGSALAMASARRGAQWLDIMRGSEQGWGLGPHVGPDVMTSSLVMHLFARTRHVIATQDRDWLLGQWSRTDGGFRFSDGPLHWGDVQTDVTAWAWPLLDDTQQRARRSKFHEYLATFAPSDGLWPSYWWSSPYLCTYNHLCMFDADDELRDQFQVDLGHLEEALKPGCSTFEIAWACACAVRSHADDLALELGQALLDRQQIDGGWRGGKDLRMTSPSCAAPWDDARGELVRDVHGCLTTSSALWALSELATLCQAREDLHYL